MLTLPIKKKWFDLIENGKKQEEYRDYDNYYKQRLLKHVGRGPFDILLRNGYASDSPTLRCKVSVSIGTGKKEWGAEEGKYYFVLNILDVIRLDTQFNN